MPNRLSIALTCDDAPTIDSDHMDLGIDPERLDRVRTLLQQLGVRHCVAFVIGRMADRDTGPLERWLESGFGLGNHTFEHRRASACNTREFLDSVSRCHLLLEKVGAFSAGRPRWFRYPYLDYGRNPQARALLRQGLAERGYRVAHASVDFYDDCYELPLARAEYLGWRWSQEVIRARFERRAEHAMLRAHESTLQAYGRPVPQIPYFHLGLVADRSLGRLLQRLVAHGVEWIDLEQASADPSYEELCDPVDSTGLMTDRLPCSLGQRLERRIKRSLSRIDVLDRHLFGPRWPEVR